MASVQGSDGEDAKAALQNAADDHSEMIKKGAAAALGQIVPILRIDIRPTNVDPGTVDGVQNMKRVLNAILNDEGNQITVKDENGRALGVRNFNEIYPQVQGPFSDGRIQVEYHEQATLGFVGDVLWALNWFFQNGILGVPQQMVSALLQAAGVRFVMETYYKQWLASILDQFNQRGLIPGFTNPKTGEDNWLLETETIGRNIVVRPASKYAYSPTAG
jgi:hypothetical protein